MEKIEIEEKLAQLRIKWSKETDSTRRLVIEKQAKLLKKALALIENKTEDIYEKAKDIFKN